MYYSGWNGYLDCLEEADDEPEEVKPKDIKISEIDDSFPPEGLSKEDADRMHDAHIKFFP